jgi:hypothetical protein
LPLFSEHTLLDTPPARRFSKLRRLIFLITIALTTLPLTVFAQNDVRIPVKGYGTASHLPDGCDLNDPHVSLMPSTQYDLIHKVQARTQSPLRDTLHAQAFGEVTTTHRSHR